MAYDFIGDVHGYASKLEALLKDLGYEERRGAYRHPDRTAVFVGDLIDRGPEQVRTVDLVRRMHEAGSAKVVMANHELNGIGYVTPDPRDPGEYLRRHSTKNRDQHAAFLNQVGEGSRLHKEYVNWFRTLPLALELGGVRVVHAWWHEPLIRTVRSWGNAELVLPDDRLVDAFDDESPTFEAADGLTKGLEVPLPADGVFDDPNGVRRTKARITWWNPAARSFKEAAIVPRGQEASVPDDPLPEGLPLGLEGDTPVFFGHYWFTGRPAPLTPKVACLDYSVGRDGPLVAYRWDGEPTLSADRFLWTC